MGEGVPAAQTLGILVSGGRKCWKERFLDWGAVPFVCSRLASFSRTDAFPRACFGHSSRAWNAAGPASFSWVVNSDALVLMNGSLTCRVVS